MEEVADDSKKTNRKVVTLPGAETDRLAHSAFFGYRGKERNLTVWS
jgi:hypothetical protein